MIELDDDFVSKMSKVVHTFDERLNIVIYPISGHGKTVIRIIYDVHVRISEQTIHLTIHDNVLVGAPGAVLLLMRLVGTLFLLARLAARAEAQGLEFILGLGDRPADGSIGFCAPGDMLLIPDFEFLQTAGYAAFRAEVDARWIDWKSRKNKVFWRGSTTGRPRPSHVFAGDAWFRVLQRSEVCARLRGDDWKDSCDVGFSQIVQLSDPSIVEHMRDHLLRSRVERVDQLDYRFLLDIDGNSNAWSGLFSAMVMGACILKVGSEQGYRQWYYDKLLPWRHYVPIAADLSDLEEKLHWALSHEETCAEIAANSCALGRSMSADDEIDDAVDRIIARSGAVTA